MGTSIITHFSLLPIKNVFYVTEAPQIYRSTLIVETPEKTIIHKEPLEFETTNYGIKFQKANQTTTIWNKTVIPFESAVRSCKNKNDRLSSLPPEFEYLEEDNAVIDLKLIDGTVDDWEIVLPSISIEKMGIAAYLQALFG